MKELARSIFDIVKSELVINSHYFGETKNLPSVKFSFYKSIKSWSHHVSLAYSDTEIFLFTASYTPIEEFKGLEVGTGNGTAWYKIPVKNANDVIKILTTHDRFPKKF